MASISDLIENFLKQMIHETNGVIEIQRNELANYFKCVPSQINYVIDTRFTAERGYIVESRRGGGGYIRIIRLKIERVEDLQELIQRQIGDAITQDEALDIVARLFEQGIINEREAAIMQAALRREALRLDLPARDMVRADLLRAMLMAILRF